MRCLPVADGASPELDDMVGESWLSRVFGGIGLIVLGGGIVLGCYVALHSSYLKLTSEARARIYQSLGKRRVEPAKYARQQRTAVVASLCFGVVLVLLGVYIVLRGVLA